MAMRARSLASSEDFLGSVMDWPCDAGLGGAGVSNVDLVGALNDEPGGGFLLAGGGCGTAVTAKFQLEELWDHEEDPARVDWGWIAPMKMSRHPPALASETRLCGRVEQINILFLAPGKEHTRRSKLQTLVKHCFAMLFMPKWANNAEI